MHVFGTALVGGGREGGDGQEILMCKVAKLFFRGRRNSHHMAPPRPQHLSRVCEGGWSEEWKTAEAEVKVL